MDWKKIAPWNWFKDEQSHEAGALPARAEGAADPFASLRAEMDRAFDRMVARAFPPSGPAPAISLRPSVDISEGKKAYTVRADLPGVDADDLSIDVEGNTLAIRAEKRRESEEEDEGYHCVERAYGLAQRMLSLPDDADSEGIEAYFKNGVLKLRIPKHPARASGGRSIEVQQG